MRKDQEMYKRNKGECSHCHRTIGPFTIIPQGIYSSTLCHACLVKAVLITEAPSPKKKRVPVSEIPENDMAPIQRGLADAKAGRTSAVRLDSPFIP